MPSSPSINHPDEVIRLEPAPVLPLACNLDLHGLPERMSSGRPAKQSYMPTPFAILEGRYVGRQS